MILYNLFKGVKKLELFLRVLLLILLPNILLFFYKKITVIGPEFIKYIKDNHHLIYLISKEFEYVFLFIILIIIMWMLYLIILDVYNDLFYSFIKPRGATTSFILFILVVLVFFVPYIIFLLFGDDCMFLDNILISDIILLTLFTGMYFLNKNKREYANPIFLSDNPIDDGECCDELGIKDDAYTFAKSVMNNNSPNSMVFGLDSPWGSGKTSYLYFCKKYWKEKHSPRPVVINFEPLIYDEKQNLFDKFIEELVDVIKSEVVNFSIKRNLSRYIIKIKEVKIRLGFLGEISFFGNSKNIENVFSDLKESLLNLDRKIIVIIDDLDRLDLENVKKMLNIVRSSFNLPNISFVLCYDSQNINSFDIKLKSRDRFKFTSRELTNELSNNKKVFNDIKYINHEVESLNNSKIIEYFEKIVQVKKILYVDKKKLKDFLEKEIRRLVKNNENLKEEKIKHFTQSLVVFFEDNNFNYYKKYLGDLRKIKRVINSIKETEALSTPVDQNSVNGIIDSDFAIDNLLKLILIYINYPDVFRDICDNELSSSEPFFSAEHTMDNNKFEIYIKNSNKYVQYLNKLNDINKINLLEGIFGIYGKEEFLKEKINDNEFRATTLLFNGHVGLNKNLSEYLNLIICKKDVISIGNHFRIKASDVLDGQWIACLKKYEKEIEFFYFFNYLNNILFIKRESERFDVKKIKGINKFLLNNLVKFSLFNRQGEIYGGFRREAVLIYLRYVDNFYWRDKIDSVDNGDSKISVLKNEIKKLINILNSGDIINIELMLFAQHYCEGSSRFYNINRAFQLLSKEESLFEFIFSIFDKNFIEIEKNIFDDAEENKDKIFGSYKEQISEAYRGYEKNKKVDDKNDYSWKNELERLKNAIISRIIHGFSGEKESFPNIYEKFQDYIFKVCFNVENKRNIKHFVIFILTQIIIDTHINYSEYKMRIDDSLVLDREKLKHYWIKNSRLIKEHRHNLRGVRVFTYNFDILIDDYIDELFNQLDELIK